MALKLFLCEKDVFTLDLFSFGRSLVKHLGALQFITW